MSMCVDLVTGDEKLQKEFKKHFSKKFNRDDFIEAIFSLPIDYDTEYGICIEYDLEKESEDIFDLLIILNCGAFSVKFPDTAEGGDEEKEEESGKSEFSLKYLNRNLTRDEWTKGEYKKLLLKKNIKDFHISFQSVNEIYFTAFFNNLTKKFPNKTIDEILNILFCSLDNIVITEEKIVVTIGSFPEAEVNKENYNLDEDIRWMFTKLFADDSIFSNKLSHLEYNNENVILTLYPKMFIGGNSNESNSDQPEE